MVSICLLSFPQNERKINKLRQLCLSHFAYFLSTEPFMFTFTKESILWFFNNPKWKLPKTKPKVFFDCNLLYFLCSDSLHQMRIKNVKKVPVYFSWQIFLLWSASVYRLACLSLFIMNFATMQRILKNELMRKLSSSIPWEGNS